MSTQKEYRRARDFRDASEEFFAILQIDLNGDDVQRAQDARRLYEFQSLLLAYTEKLEAKSDSRKAELLKARGALEFVSKRVIIASEKHDAKTGQGEEKGGNGDGY